MFAFIYLFILILKPGGQRVQDISINIQLLTNVIQCGAA